MKRHSRNSLQIQQSQKKLPAVSAGSFFIIVAMGLF